MDFSNDHSHLVKCNMCKIYCKAHKMPVQYGKSTRQFFKSLRIDVMPNLSKIRTYITNRRRQLGDINIVVQFKDHISTLIYNEELRDSEMFIFGRELGDGSDEKLNLKKK